MRVTRREFQRSVRRAFGELPLGIQQALENVAVLVEDWPEVDDLETARPEGQEDVLGLYTGVPLSERDGGDPALPDTITLFQRPLESACTSREELTREIKTTLRHEVGHYLGMSEEELEHLGYG